MVTSAISTHASGATMISGGGSTATANGATGLQFSDLLDVVNPLQQLPIVSNIYRATTGATINPISRILGGALFGGPIGAVAALASTVFEQVTGSDPASMAMAMISPSSASAGGNGEVKLAKMASVPVSMNAEVSKPSNPTLRSISSPYAIQAYLEAASGHQEGKVSSAAKAARISSGLQI